MQEGKIYNVLFLCTGNSARSIMAEATLNHLGGGRFRAFSAGSQPKGEVHPAAVHLLQRTEISIEGLRSKSWDEFAAPGAPQMNFVFTVCDNAAGEACPLWPGSPVTAHWGVEDPAACTGSQAEQDKAFAHACRQLTKRIQLFISLPFAKLDAISLKQEVREIGKA